MKVIINYQEYPHVEVEKEMLRAEFPDIEIIESKTRDEDEFIKEAEGIDAALVQFAPINKKVIDTLTTCKGYVRYGIGYDNIDAEYAAGKGKMVANVQQYCIDEVSNHALALLMELNRKIMVTHNLVMDNSYDFPKIRNFERLKDTTMGIVGIGNIGKCFADKVQSLVKRVVFYDPFVDEYKGCEKLDTLEELFEISDNISLHLLLNESTKGIITRQLLGKMKPTAFMINTSRGGVMDEKALADILAEGRIAGAGLDVFEVEPLPEDSPLRGIKNTILTHHSAWYSEGSINELQRRGADQVISVLKGERPEFAVDEMKK
ncbi:MAG: C-terminal binding protein [Planctomycetota bacterium]|jgi:D-3-phosphoglycerate dehydrogenase